MKHSPRFVAIVDDAKQRIREVTAGETNAKLQAGEDVLVLDVREESEWEQGHVRGATHMGKGIIERDIESVAGNLDREIILYCGGGYRSALAADNLQKMGYTNVASLAGGWRGWNELDLPVEN